MAAEFEIGRKASILSVLSEKYEATRKSLGLETGSKEPVDKFYLVHATCFLLGFMNVVPMFFFNVASKYWLYKFRDPNEVFVANTNANSTTLQIYYQPSSTVAQQVPSVLFSALLTLYGHKIAAMKRTVWSLLLMVVLYFIFAVFTQINTDTWQTEFFVMTMLLLVCNSALTATIQMSTAVLIAKLPPYYMFFFLIGQNGTFLSTCLQIISLAVTDDQPTTGLIYFSTGAIVILITFLLLALSRKSKLFKHYDVEDLKDTSSETISWEEAKDMIRVIWPCLALALILIWNVGAIQSSIIILVAPENMEDHTPWTDKFFRPFSVFLLPEITSILGRIISRKLVITESNKWWYVSLAILRFIVTIPVFMLCNAQPRTIPVVFDKDWEFMLFCGLNGFTMGWLLNVAFSSIKSLLPKKQEGGLKLLTLTLSVTSAVTCTQGLLMVKLLTV